MELSKFYKDFLAILNKYEVRYMMIGGYAVNIHGYPRFTGDMDLWSSPAEENVEKLIKSIDEFGFDTEILKGENLESKSPVRLKEEGEKIEVLHSLVGCKFEDAYTQAEKIVWSGVEVKVISLQDLINNKKSTMRLKDALDVEQLTKIQELKNKKPNN